MMKHKKLSKHKNKALYKALDNMIACGDTSE